MGCVQSRKDINDVHPNVFRVVNVDEAGCSLWAGQLEVTAEELVLYRRGKEPTRWPLRSLRRYGFDADTFSFESGRRCTTGQGIYAFKCRRAEQLFGTLQRCIQATNSNSENVLDALSRDTASRPPGTLPRPPLEPAPAAPVSVSLSGEYLEPAPAPTAGRVSRFSGVIRLGSVGSGPLSPEVHSPGSPSGSNILEVMPLAPLPAPGANHQVTNLYQMQDFSFPREHNNNRKAKGGPAEHSYLNTGDVDSDLANLRRALRERPISVDEDANAENGGEPAGRSDDSAPMSPTPSSSSEHYATLAVEREADSRPYMNVGPGEAIGALPAIREESKRSARSDRAFAATPTSATPSSNPKTFDFRDAVGCEIEEEIHDYANLKPGEIDCDRRLLARRRSFPSRGSAVSEAEPANGAISEMNYAEIDLEKPESEEEAVKPCAIGQKEPAIGYTTIDFDKTAALTLVAQGTEVDTEGSRKTRHNSTALPPSPTVT